MKKQLEDGIKLISEVISETPPESDRYINLLKLLGTLQGLLIMEVIK